MRIRIKKMEELQGRSGPAPTRTFVARLRIAPSGHHLPHELARGPRFASARGWSTSRGGTTQPQRLSEHNALPCLVEHLLRRREPGSERTGLHRINLRRRSQLLLRLQHEKHQHREGGIHSRASGARARQIAKCANNEIHACDEANKVRFAPANDSVHLLRRRFGHGDNVKLP